VKRSRAVFLDRDGVLIEDVNLVQNERDIHILPGVPEALRLLKSAGFLLITISNQTVIARGILNEQGVESLNGIIEDSLIHAGAPRLNGFYYCPHHPNANLEAYRVDCDCRKPKPGLILKAARDHDVALDDCIMIGDRITDIIAGTAAGCRTILVKTGMHKEPPIQTSMPLDMSVKPNFTCRDLLEAARWILEGV